ncbi:unnamed protein product [Paramecium primaurelia]|uniref:Uncharacterized protein n=1 Tax=Paramecium primaurelia TaxID=5886 RepID=A0A8S1QVC1_PARPR|nr:unnamed protein product [Paramecium primaurelia]
MRQFFQISIVNNTLSSFYRWNLLRQNKLLNLLKQKIYIILCQQHWIRGILYVLKQSYQVLTNCTQLETISECFYLKQYFQINYKICVWNASSGNRSQLFCSSHSTQDSCTYIFQNISKSNIQIFV